MTRRFYIGEWADDTGMNVVAGERTIESIDVEYRARWTAAVERHGSAIRVPREEVDTLREWHRTECLRRHGLDGGFRSLTARPARRASYAARATRRAERDRRILARRAPRSGLRT